MKLFTRPELHDLRRRLAGDPAELLRSGDLVEAAKLVETLIGQAEYGLDCAALLDEAVHYPAEPYGEAEELVVRLTNGVNEIWNRHRD